MSEQAKAPEAAPIRKFRAPAVNVETQAFWDAAAEGRFLVKHCNACGKAHWYPRAICPHCFSPDTVWKESQGEGVIYTYSVMYRSPTGPYAIGYVTLDEGPAMLTNFVDCDLSALKIGQRVKVKFTATEDGPPVPTFTTV